MESIAFDKPRATIALNLHEDQLFFTAFALGYLQMIFQNECS